jgi:hypothetical protein
VRRRPVAPSRRPGATLRETADDLRYRRHRELLLLIGLGYAFAIVGAGTEAPLPLTALVTFVIVFGIGVAPFLDEPGASLATRLFYLSLACAYALVALTLTDPWLSRGAVSARDVR